MSDNYRQPPNDGSSRPITLACPDNVPPEMLSAWRDGLLPAGQSAWLDRHTPGCAACGERLRDYAAAGSALNTQVIPRSGSDLWPGVRDAIEREAPGHNRRLSRGLALGGIGAAVAALLLVALFAGLLFSRNLGHITSAATPSATTGPAPTASATAAATAVPHGPGLWTTMTGCPDNAPASVKTVYDSSIEGQKGAPAIVTFQRSDNCGASWTPMTPPAISGLNYTTDVDYMNVLPNSVNSRIAYLLLRITNTAGCSASSSAAAEARLSSNPCQRQYVTTDGGATWNPLSLPVKGVLGGVSKSGFSGMGVEGALRPQGSSLYAVVTDTILGISGVTPPGRLVVSHDGGVTWASADSALSAQGLGVYDFAVPPSGSTIYVTAQPFNDPNDQPPAYAPTLSLWSSPDGGQTWTENAHGPDGSYGQGGGIANMTAGMVGSRPVLYLIAGNKGQMQLLGSFDGGANWSIDTAYPSASGYGPLGTLPDGSVVLETSDPTQPTLSWLPGSSESEIAAGAGLQYYGNPVFQATAHGEVLWLTGVVNASTGASATMYVTLKL